MQTLLHLLYFSNCILQKSFAVCIALATASTTFCMGAPPRVYFFVFNLTIVGENLSHVKGMTWDKSHLLKFFVR